MFVEVIPAERGPLHLPFLDYMLPPEIEERAEPGQLVTIPIRSQIKYGIIRRLKPDSATPPERLKKLTGIVFDVPLISKKELAFLDDIASLYQASLGLVVKSALLPLQKKKLAELVLPEKMEETARAPQKPTVSIYRSEKEKAAYLEKVSDVPGQLLILVPEIRDIKKLYALLSPEKQTRTILVSSELPPKNYSTAWQALWRKEKTIVIGTRQALFLPWKDLTNIIIDDEGNPSYKSTDMAPRFHTRDVALLLSQHFGALLHLLAPVLSPETYYFATKKIYNAAGQLLPEPPANLHITSLLAEHRSGNRALIGNDVEEAVTATRTGTILFLCHRRGTMTYVGCSDCGQILSCPSCSQPLTYYQKKNQLECRRCRYQSTMVISCPHCQSISLFMGGHGTEAAVHELKKLLPGDPRPILQIDRDEKAPTLPEAGDAIIVGTSLALRYVDWEKVKLVVDLDSDLPLSIPEYKAAEEAWHELWTILYHAPRTASLYVQTEHAEHPFFQFFHNPAGWYENELSGRQRFGYPPFRYILKLFRPASSAALAMRAAEELQDLLYQLTKNNSDVTIAPIQAPMPALQRGRYWKILIVKLAYSHYKKNSRSILMHVPSEWKVDPNPNSLLTV